MKFECYSRGRLTALSYSVFVLICYSLCLPLLAGLDLSDALDDLGE